MKTERFDLPYLQAGQAQKEMTYNEALTLMDLALHPVAESAGLNVPPADPAAGLCWITGNSPVGAWEGHPLEIAGWTAGGWRFLAATAGMTVWIVDQGCWSRFDGTQWRLGDLVAKTLHINGVQVIGARQAAIASPNGGSVVDIEARGAITAILAALYSHGLIDS